MKINNEQSIVEYLNHVRKRKTNSPPSAEEIETLISYLKTNGLDPIIVGALAVVSYLKPSSKNIAGDPFRQTEDIDIFVTKLLPSPPSG